MLLCLSDCSCFIYLFIFLLLFLEWFLFMSQLTVQMSVTWSNTHKVSCTIHFFISLFVLLAVKLKIQFHTNTLSEKEEDFLLPHCFGIWRHYWLIIYHPSTHLQTKKIRASRLLQVSSSTTCTCKNPSFENHGVRPKVLNPWPASHLSAIVAHRWSLHPIFKFFFSPFDVDCGEELPFQHQMELIDFQASEDGMSKFLTWDDFTTLSPTTLQVESIFGTTYRWEHLLSKMIAQLTGGGCRIHRLPKQVFWIWY